MTSLIACLSTGKGTWGHVARLINEHDWEKIFLVTNEFGREKFSSEKPIELIVINDRMGIEELVESIKSQLQGKVRDTDVAINFVSGSGKEHMAMLSALLKLGLGIRLIALTKDGMKEI